MKIKEGGVMDIQKEREAFEELIDIEIIISEGFKFNPNINQYYHPDHTNHRLSYAYLMGAWMVWQEKAQAVPEWISVKDNLPPENILVLGMSQTRSNIFNVYNVMALDEFEEAEVTHWMPLPDAPQEPAND
ncbi:DUF551 domain-containing protein [Acinetobacter variabilis]|uniref:DUF551 domain-containing protein n=1 Tax=Acinetobacter variabilis TaxID=70346 RepID=UPI0035D47824